MLRRLRISTTLTLPFAIALLVAPDAAAVDDESADIVNQCQYSSTVRVDGHCTGIYVGSRIVLTAGHCTNGETINRVTFGEADSGSGKHVDVDVVECVHFPDGEPTGQVGTSGYDGVDLAYCVLAQEPPDVPIIPPMVPTGCARDWLAREVYIEHSYSEGPPSTMVGMGCADGQSGGGDCNDGDKRALVGELTAQFPKAGTTTKLRLNDTLAGGAGMMPGDSGGPAIIQLPDGSWRVVGVLHSSGVQATYEAIPPYLNWIENEAGVDISPCHDRINGVWEFHGECEGNLPLNPALTGSWNNSCQPGASAFGGGEDECAGWDTGPWLGSQRNPFGVIAWRNQGWVPAPAMIEIAVGTLRLVLSTDDDSRLGLPRDEDAINDFIVAAGDPIAVDPFLFGQPSPGYLPLTSTAKSVARTIAKFLRLPKNLEPGTTEPTPG